MAEQAVKGPSVRTKHARQVTAQRKPRIVGALLLTGGAVALSASSSPAWAAPEQPSESAPAAAEAPPAGDDSSPAPADNSESSAGESAPDAAPGHTPPSGATSAPVAPVRDSAVLDAPAGAPPATAPPPASGVSEGPRAPSLSPSAGAPPGEGRVPSDRETSAQGTSRPSDNAAAGASEAPSPVAISIEVSAGDNGGSEAAGAPNPTTSTSVDITVAGTPLRRTAGSAHVIDEKKLERYEYDDPHAVLTQVPGVYVRTEDGMGLRPNIGLRGVNPERSKKVTLLEDGVLFGPAPYSAPAAYYFPLVTRMVGVKVIKGPGAVSYGPQTVAGTINFLSRYVPAQTQFGADLALGQYGYAKAHLYAGSGTERTGFLIEGVHLQNSGFKELPNDSDTGFARNEWVVKGRFVPDPYADVYQELQLRLSYADEVSNETYLGLAPEDFEANPNARYAASNLDQMRNHRASIVLTHRLETPAGIALRTDAYRHDYERTWRKVNGFRGASLFEILTEDTPRNQLYRSLLRGEMDSTVAEALLIGPNERRFVSQGIQSVFSWTGQTGPLDHRLETGLRYHYDSVARRQTEDAFLLMGGEPFPEGSATAMNTANKASTHALAAHAVYALGYRSVTLTPGVRAEFIRSAHDNYLNDISTNRFDAVVLPGVGAFYAVDDQLGLLAGVYRGFSPAPPGSDDAVRPERSWNFEGGARYHDRAARVEAIGFYNRYSNLTDVCTFATGCVGQDVDRQFDAGEARIYGIEALGEVTIPAGSFELPLGVNYTWTRGEFTNSFRSDDPIFGDVSSGDEMPYLPQHQLRASAAVMHERAGGHAAVTYASAMREVASHEPLGEVLSTEAQVMLDLGAFVQLNEFLRLYANVQNVLDTRRVASHRPFGARPNAPRWAHVGLKARF